MRNVHRYLNWGSNSEIIKIIKNILEKFEIKYNYKENIGSAISTFNYQLEFYLYEDDKNFLFVKEALNNIGLKEQVVGSIYEKRDFENAEWFIVNTGSYQYPQPEDGYLETTFNTNNYCKHCGIGKVQDAPYRLKTEPKQLNNQFWGLYWEYEPIFVRQAAKNIFEKENIKEISFSKPFLHRKNIEVESLHQMHINTILENGFDNHNAKTITCKINNEEDCNKDKNVICCGRIKYHHPLVGGYVFNKDVFNPEIDIALTGEYFGSGSSANRLQIVSKKIKNLVEKNKLKGLQFIPVLHNRN
ncbi:hypothetical protein G4D82_12215 [Flavobacterium sp. CYK-4]|uniref:hypothetical protein n=1 Tax=Flavobacterium lotistagni TaxID=2709660 RepID=UPI0014076A18|nr:hypothetical protein [Flavobacterium lotistagni]NHM07990.1 hypothetical protein [Flavobacterium lotistagni]